MSLFRAANPWNEDSVWADTTDQPAYVLDRHMLPPGPAGDELWALLVEQIPARGDS